MATRRGSRRLPHAASMGPRTIVRGNGPRRGGYHPLSGRFNGAADDRPRKLPDGDVVCEHHTGFNGAADDRPRKSGGRGPLPAGLRRASMGPRTIVRGNSPAPRPDDETVARFNGAADDRPRKYSASTRFRSVTIPLQWGRGRSSAEIGALLVRAPRQQRASMGPRTIVRGNSRRSAVPCARRGFNGAADDRPRKYGRVRAYASLRFIASMGPRTIVRGNVAWFEEFRMYRRELQWGRGRSSAEIPPAAGGESCPSCFNGAADDRPRKSLTRWPRPGGTTCFNGAADDRPRKLRALDGHMRGAVAASMGPRTIVRGNCAGTARICPSGVRFNGAADDRPRK